MGIHLPMIANSSPLLLLRAKLNFQCGPWQICIRCMWSVWGVIRGSIIQCVCVGNTDASGGDKGTAIIPPGFYLQLTLEDNDL